MLLYCFLEIDNNPCVLLDLQIVDHMHQALDDYCENFIERQTLLGTFAKRSRSTSLNLCSQTHWLKMVFDEDTLRLTN